MNVVFVSDSFHHHQKPFSDEMYNLTSARYRFIATGKMREERKKMGWRDTDYPSYVIELDMGAKDEVKRIMELIADADIVITGSAPLSLFALRNKRNKITFRYSERLYKTRLRYLKAPIHTVKSLWMRNDYMLCASAYTSKDYSLTGCYRGKCYKWAYFTEVRKYDTKNALFSKKSSFGDPVRLLWVSRFIPLKHPEIPILFARKLLSDGIPFIFTMIGIGPLRKSIEDQIAASGLQGYISIIDSLPPEKVRDKMEESDIFLFTSDRQEGWGAVLNESMNSGCAVIANRAIGSVPYLIKDQYNGYIYDDGDLESAYQDLLMLINHRDIRQEMGWNAYMTINEIWNPKIAASNLLTLYNYLKTGKDTPFEYGPCSKA